jgi:hypothetical protein
MTQTIRRTSDPSPAFSIPAILAIICAIASFMVGALLGLILAVLAIIFGAIGVLMSISPQRRGGVISMVSIVAGAIGIVAALIRMIMWFVA